MIVSNLFLKSNLILKVLAERKIDSGSCIKFNKQYYLPTDCNGHAVYYRKRTTDMVVKTFNNQLFFSTAEKVYALELISDLEQYYIHSISLSIL